MRVVHHKSQRSTGTERGRRSLVMCRSIPATADHLQDWPRMRAGMVDCLLTTGGGLRARPAFHHLDFRAQPRWQAFVYAHKSHSLNSAALDDHNGIERGFSGAPKSFAGAAKGYV